MLIKYIKKLIMKVYRKSCSNVKKKKNVFPKKIIIYYGSNFFVFQSYELRFSGKFCLVLIRSFPGSFVIGSIPGVPLGIYQVPDFGPNSKL